MAGEKQPSAIVPLSELYPQTEGHEAIMPVGVIVYANYSRIVLLGHNTEGFLVSTHIDAPQNFNPKSVAESRRVMDLRGYEEVHVGAVEFGQQVTISTNRSLDARPSIQVHFNYQDSDTGEQEQFDLEEADLLAILSEQGVLVQLTGPIKRGSGKTEAALLISQTVPARTEEEKEVKVAHVLFFREESSEEWLDSVMGIGTFLNQLNDRLQSTASEYQRTAIYSFKEHVERREIKFDFPLQQVITLTRVMALAGQYEQTGDESLRKQLERALPSLRSDATHRAIFRLRRIFRLKNSASKEAVEALREGMILGKTDARRKALTEVKPREDKALPKPALDEPEICRFLKTPRMKDKRVIFGKDFDDRVKVGNYLMSLYMIVGDSHITFSELEDMERLLDEVEATDFPKLQIFLNVKHDDRQGGFIISNVDFYPPVGGSNTAATRLIWSIRRNIQARKKKWQN